jgi:hypothetical protein
MLMFHHIKDPILVIAVLAGFGAQDTGWVPRIQNNFDIILKQGGVMDLHTLEELDRTSRNQVDTRSEATCPSSI